MEAGFFCYDDALAALSKPDGTTIQRVSGIGCDIVSGGASDQGEVGWVARALPGCDVEGGQA